MAEQEPKKQAGDGRTPKDQSWGRYLGYGLQMALGVGLGLLVGNWLDQHYGWEPWGVLVGSMLGMAAGMYLLIKEGLKMNKS